VYSGNPRRRQYAVTSPAAAGVQREPPPAAVRRHFTRRGRCTAGHPPAQERKASWEGRTMTHPQSADIRPSSRHYVQSLPTSQMYGRTMATRPLRAKRDTFATDRSSHTLEASAHVANNVAAATPLPYTILSVATSPQLTSQVSIPAKIIQGWRRLPLGYQKRQRDPRRQQYAVASPAAAGVQRDPRRWQRAVASPRHPPMAGVQGKHPQRAQSRQVTPPPADGRCTAGPTPTHADRRQPITLPRQPAKMASVQRDRRRLALIFATVAAIQSTN